MKKTTAIVLAAGSGKRMKSSIRKQYLMIEDKPLLYYSLKAFDDSFIDNIVLVTGKGEEQFCREEIINKYDIRKVSAIVEGGKERYHSVAYGLRAVNRECDYVFIHDGARPFIDNEILKRALDDVVRTRACVVGMPVKDTVKISDRNGYVADTPARSLVWQIQTPQVFEKELISDAYEKLLFREEELLKDGVNITDDAMVVEFFTDVKVKLTEGSYRNIKITTPEDLDIAKIFINK